ncbi:hypothetical protein GCM10010106_17570 [Thermopolyspora flexuosa]|nr:hypothetical protein GCM10010106_17570 [Thermopolyspora flexuosa]
MLLLDFSSDDYVIVDEADAPTGPTDRITVVTAGGRPVAAFGPQGELGIRIYPGSASVGIMRYVEFSELTGRKLLVVLTGPDDEIVGVIRPDVVYRLAFYLLPTELKREVVELPGPPERTSRTKVACPHCGRRASYPLVEPGETTCLFCGEVLRPE